MLHETIVMPIIFHDHKHEINNVLILGVPLSTTRKRQRSNDEDDEAAAPAVIHKTWKEALGTPPVFGTTRAEHIAWIRFQKKKWEWQWKQRRGGIIATRVFFHSR